MRLSLAERDPRRVAEQRLAAEDAESLNAHLRECAEIAILLARESDRALETAAKRGRAALKAAQKEREKRLVLARFFATEALMHLSCPARACKRAHSCAGRGVCTAGETLSREAETAARGRLKGFLRFMQRPEDERKESESEEGLGGRGSRAVALSGSIGRNRIQNPAESHDTGGR